MNHEAHEDHEDHKITKTDRLGGAAGSRSLGLNEAEKHVQKHQAHTHEQRYAFPRRFDSALSEPRQQHGAGARRGRDDEADEQGSDDEVQLNTQNRGALSAYRIAAFD